MRAPEPRHNYRPYTQRGTAAALAFSVMLIADAGAAIDLSGVDSAVGPWEIVLHNTERRCGMQLRADRIANVGHIIGMPAGCRRALPILTDVGGWRVTGDRKLEFGDKAGNPVLSFAPGDKDSLLAKGPEGETYELFATGRQRYAQANPGAASQPVAAPGIRTLPAAQGPAALPVQNAAPAPATTPAPTQQTAQRQSAQAPPPPAAPTAGGSSAAVKPFTGRPADLSGRYIILRENGKDVGCMLTFNDQARGPAGSFKAQLAPACRDNGIVVFDPQGWQIDRGRIALTARKGHKAMFLLHEDGDWWKDPKEGGKPLGIRKMVR